MSIIKTKFGEYNEKNVYLYTLTNQNGLSAEILDYGGIVRKIVYKNTDVVLGRDTLEEYLNNEGYFGALIGRNSNRIENAEFELNSKNYKLSANEKGNNLHGGKEGWDKKLWTAEMIDYAEPSLVLSYISPDGEEGFPGEVRVKVTYTVTNDNSLQVKYEGEADKDTVFNMTNHSYFNLNGHASGKIDSHSLWIDSDFYTPNKDNCVPNGEILSVKNTPFDFSVNETLGEKIASNHEQTVKFGGIDHNLVLNGVGYRKVAELRGDKTGIVMEVFTDKVGMQVYSGNVIEKNRICKDGAVYSTHSGICLETQDFPNCLRIFHFPRNILRKGEKRTTVTAFRFL